MHSCLYTDDEEQQSAASTLSHTLTRQKSSEHHDERVVIDQPLLDPKSFKWSWVHHSSCGEVLRDRPKQRILAIQPIWPSATCSIAQAFSSLSSFSEFSARLTGSGLLCENLLILGSSPVKASTLRLADSAAAHRTAWMVWRRSIPWLRLLKLPHQKLLHHHVILRTYSRYLRSLFLFHTPP